MPGRSLTPALSYIGAARRADTDIRLRCAAVAGIDTIG